MSAAEIAEFNAIVTAIGQTLQSNYSATAAITFLAYDILSTFIPEVEYIWKQRWTVAKVLYIFSRYYGVFYLGFSLSVQTKTNTELTVPFCKRYYWFDGICGEILFTTTLNVIFIMRLNALYQRNRKILIALIILLVCEFVAEFTVTVRTAIIVSKGTTAAPLGLPFPGCITIGPEINKMALGAWIPNLLVATIFFAMTVYKFLQMLNERGDWHLLNLRETQSVSPLITAFVRDGTIFYLMTFAVVLFCMIINLTITSALASIGLPWIMAIYSVSASRLVLNVRRAAADMYPSDGTESLTLTTLPWSAVPSGSRSRSQINQLHGVSSGTFVNL